MAGAYLAFLRRSHPIPKTITPTYGAELLSDPGLEGTYTSGLVAGYTKGGSPTISQSADVHGGSKAQQFTPTANSDNLSSPSIFDGNGFAKYGIWAKRTAGASGLVKWQISSALGTAKYQPGISAAVWTYFEATIRSGNNTNFYVVNRDAAVFDTIIFDDVTAKKITLSSTLANKKTHAANTIARAAVTVPTGYQGGVACNLNSVTNPTYGVFAYVDANPTTGTVAATLDQVLNGVWTRLIHASITYVAGAPVEVRNVGTTYQLWYNGVQVGADQTINDATLRASRLAAQFATSPNVIFGGFQP